MEILHLQAQPPLAWWLSPSDVVLQRLQTPEKRAAMTPGRMRQYKRVQRRTVLPAHASGSTGLEVFDMQQLTSACGANCTSDGIHYAPAVYDAALQLLLHGLIDRTP